MTIYLASDHGGFELKEQIKTYFKNQKHKVSDLGAAKLDPGDDYPPFAFALAERVGHEDDTAKSWPQRPKGILFCRSGIGVTVAANKVPGARAAAVYDEKMVTHARQRDDVNVIAISGDWTDLETAKKLITKFLETPTLQVERHQRRVLQIIAYESGHQEGGCCGGGCCGGCN